MPILTAEQIDQIERAELERIRRDHEGETWPDVVLKAYIAGFIGGLAYYERHFCMGEDDQQTLTKGEINMQAILPDSLCSQSLRDLPEGQKVFTMPWAMYADENGKLWLNDSYPYKPSAQGTSTLQVTKRNGEYTCDVGLCLDFSWSRGRPYFVGEFSPIPVASLLGTP